MKNIYGNKRRIRIAILICVIAVMCATSAMAARNPTREELEQQYADNVDLIYRTFATVAYPLATISLAIAAFRMFAGDDKSIASAKKQIAFTAFALAGILLLPKIIEAGVMLGQKYGWHPPENHRGGSSSMPVYRQVVDAIARGVTIL